MTEEEQHIAAIELFLSTYRQDRPADLPVPCSDWRCGFCNYWYRGRIQDRAAAYRARTQDRAA